MNDLLTAAAGDLTSIVGGLLIGFACGSIPFGYLLVRLTTGADVRRAGSGNIGATNVSRSLGLKGGVLTLLLDAAKGAAGVAGAAWIGVSWLGIEQAAWPWAGALGAVLGHCYTPWLRLRGGKGVATLLGAFGIAAPGPALAAAVTLLLVATVSRMMSAASLCGALLLPAAIWWWRAPSYPGYGVAAALLAAIVIVWRHRANIGRIARGEERRLGSAGA